MRTLIRTIAVATAVLVVGVTSAQAVVVDAAPTFPIPTDAPFGPPPIPALPAAGNEQPPAGAIADPVTPAAACGGWYLQSHYGNRWPGTASWWAYQCTYEHSVYYDPCSGGTGACNASCDYCYAETESRT